MQRLVASLLALSVGFTATGWAGLCFCHEAPDAAAPTAAADDEHSCCHGDAEAAQAPTGPVDALEAVCLAGCCDASVEDVRVEPERRQRFEAQRPALVLSAAQALPPRTATRVLLATAPLRGPPPPALSARLASLQIWRC